MCSSMSPIKLFPHYYCIHKKKPLIDHTLHQFTPVHIITPDVSSTLFNIISKLYLAVWLWDFTADVFCKPDA